MKDFARLHHMSGMPTLLIHRCSRPISALVWLMGTSSTRVQLSNRTRTTYQKMLIKIHLVIHLKRRDCSAAAFRTCTSGYYSPTKSNALFLPDLKVTKF